MLSLALGGASDFNSQGGANTIFPGGPGLDRVHFDRVGVTARALGIIFFVILTVQKLPAIGLLKALGYSTSSLVSAQLIQILLVIGAGLVVGAGLGLVMARSVKMTGMPQMVRV